MRRLAAFALLVLGLALVAACGAQAHGSLVVGIEYTGGAWPAHGQLFAGRVTISDRSGHRVRVLDVKAGKTATAELPPGRYMLSEKRRGGCPRKTATVTGSHTTRYTVWLGCWPSTPQGVEDSITAAARAQKSVHFSEFFSADLYGGDHRTFDVGADSGSELLTYYAHKMRILLVDHTVYVRGDAWMLGGTMYTPGIDLTQAQVKRYAGKWISIPKGDKDYAGWADGLTLSGVVGGGGPISALTPWYPTGRLTLSKRRSHGERLLILRQTSGSQGFPPIDELRARATGIPLPVSYSDYMAMMLFDDGTYSRWNEPVRVRAPTRSIPIATVRRS